MNNYAQDLLLLTANLSQIKSRDLVVQSFIEKVNAIFPNFHFSWNESELDSKAAFEVCSRTRVYGFVEYNENGMNGEIKALIQNACKLLTIMLENLELEKIPDDKLDDKLKKSSEELIVTTTKLETLIEVSPLAIILLDSFGNVQLWNKAAEKIFGWSASELLGSQLPTVPPEEKGEFLTFSSQISRGDTIVNKEVVRLRKDGTKVCINLSSAPIFNSSREVVGRMAILADITEKKQIEQELIEAKKIAEENEAWLRSIFASANIGIAVTDRSGKWVNWNKTTNRLFGLTDEEMRRKTNLEITHPDDIVESIEKINLVLERKIDNYRIEKRYLKKDDTFWWADLSVSPLIKNNQVIAFVGIASDITSRKNSELELVKSKEEVEKSEEKYRLLLENMNDLVCEIDRNGIYTYLNNKYIDVLGYHPLELLGKPASDLIHPDDLKASIEKFDGLITNVGDSIDVWRFKHKIGRYRLIESKGKVFVNSKGEMSTVVISRDITAQFETEQALIRAKEKAEESDRLKTAFLQNMSHEIRTPMNAIIGFSEILTSKFEDKVKMKKFAGIISQRGYDLLDIINDILDIAKIESGQFPVTLDECSLVNLFEELTTFFAGYQKRIGKEHISLDLRAFCDPDQTIIVTDKLKLRQILINLVTNALKFTDEGSVKGGCKYESDGMMKFFVSDTGIGIPKDKQELIFERFAQLDQGKRVNIGGTGLGLSIVKGMVHLLGGKISLESEPAKGSTFCFYLPVKAVSFQR